MEIVHLGFNNNNNNVPINKLQNSAISFILKMGKILNIRLGNLIFNFFDDDVTIYLCIIYSTGIYSNSQVTNSI